MSILNRDDLGHRNDKINAGTAQERIVYVNREIINIRGFQQGEYTVNGHMFFEHEPEGKERVEVEVEVLKLNPFEEIFAGTRTFAGVDKNKLCSFFHDAKWSLL